MLKYLWFLPAGIVALGIFILSTMVVVSTEGLVFDAIDKVEHALAYCVLTACAVFGLYKSDGYLISRVVWVVFLCAMYGLFLELVQYSFFALRKFEWMDALANAVGVVMGLLIFKYLKRVI